LLTILEVKPCRPSLSAREPRRLWTFAAGFALFAACSVFPDHAELPTAVSGGSSSTSGGDNNSGGVSGAGSASGGRATAGEATGGSATGGSSTSGATNGGTSGGKPSNTGGRDPESGGASQAGEPAGGAAGAGGSPPAIEGGAAGTPSTGGSLNTGGGPSTGGSGGSQNECVTTKLAANRDSYLLESDSKSNFGGANRLLLSGVLTARANAVVGFDFTQLPAGRVTSATLSFVLGSRSGGASPTLSVYALDQSFAENRVTWLNARNGQKWLVAGGDIALLPTSSVALGAATVGAKLAFDITKDVVAILAGTLPDNGWLVTTGPSDCTLELGSRELLDLNQQPVLDVETCP
jgi:hypothetical protein